MPPTVLMLRLSILLAILSSPGRVSTAFAPIPAGGRTSSATGSSHRGWATTSSRLHNKPSKKKVPEYFIEDDDDEAEDASLHASSIHSGGDVPVIVDAMAPRAEGRDADDSSYTFDTAVSQSSQAAPAPFLVALAPGAAVTIQVGDVGRARKAWKKRRRSGSPLLVPCSILSVDAMTTLRGNCLYLLDKFGSPGGVGDSSKSQGIAIDLPELATRHRTHLKLALGQQVQLLGYHDTQELVRALFPKSVQDAVGVELVEDADDGSLILQTASSRMRAQRRANAVAIVQFNALPEDKATTDDEKVWEHTGMIRIRRSDAGGSSSAANFYSFKPLSAALRIHHASQNDWDIALETGSVHQAAVFEYDPVGDAGGPLLVMAPNANRVPQRERSKPSLAPLDAEADNGGEKLPRYTLDELSVGLELPGKVVQLTKGGVLIDCGVRRLRRDKSWTKVWGRLNFRDAVTDTEERETHYGTSRKKKSRKNMIKAHWLEEEEEEDDDDDDDDVDDEPFDSDNTDMFNEFDWDELDAEDDEEFDVDSDNDNGESEGEDITHLFSQNPDGTLSYTDPDTGETDIIMADDEEEDTEEELDDDEYEDVSHMFQHDDDGSISFTDPKTGETHQVYSDGDDGDLTHLFEQHDDGTLSYKGSEPAKESKEALEDVRLEKEGITHRAGHVVTASQIMKRPHYIRVGDEITVFVKSVSKNSGQFSLTTNASAKEKSAKDLKREGDVTKRLSRLSKQLGGLHGIEQLLGTECDGRVKATSNTGSWLYVEPFESKIPVGVATLSNVMLETLVQGDNVRIRIEGIDEGRGQLAMRILRRLQP